MSMVGTNTLSSLTVRVKWRVSRSSWNPGTNISSSTRRRIKGTIATYLGVAIVFVTTFFILTLCLMTEEVRLTRVLVDAATLFSSLALLGTGSSAMRFYTSFQG
jgi:hypothetical protein